MLLHAGLEAALNCLVGRWEGLLNQVQHDSIGGCPIVLKQRVALQFADRLHRYNEFLFLLWSVAQNSWGPGWGESGYVRIQMTSDSSGVCKWVPDLLLLLCLRPCASA